MKRHPAAAVESRPPNPTHIDAVRNVVAAKRHDPFFKRRHERNVENPPTRFSREEFWRFMIVCICTSVQKSGPNSRVSKFVRDYDEYGRGIFQQSEAGHQWRLPPCCEESPAPLPERVRFSAQCSGRFGRKTRSAGRQADRREAASCDSTISGIMLMEFRTPSVPFWP